MKTDTRILVPPTNCACRFRVNANWANAPEYVDDVCTSHKMPIPFSITSIEMVATCPEHASFLTEPLPADPYYDLHTEPVGKTSAGYICVGDTCVHPDRYGNPKHANPRPVASLSDAERAFVHFTQFTGLVQRFKGSCDCCAYMVYSKRDASCTYKHSGKHTHHCKHHPDDDEQCSAARNDIARLEAVKQRIVTEHPELTREVINNPFTGKDMVIDDTNRSLLTSFSIPSDQVRRELIEGVEVKYDDKRAVTVIGVDETTRQSLIEAVEPVEEIVRVR